MLEELIIRTLCDTLPNTPVDGVYLFTQTEDNQASSFAAALQLITQGVIEKVCFIQTPAMSGYPGFAAWKEELIKRGVPEDTIAPVPPVPADTDMLHTRIEAESIIHYAKLHGFKSILVTAPPFHQTRAFMAAVTATLSIYPALEVYSFPGEALPWQQAVAHSQGEVQDSRAGLIAGEVERIHKYQAKGDLAAVSEVLEYLNKRN